MKTQEPFESSCYRSLQKLDLDAIAQKCGWLRRLGSKLDASAWCHAFIAASAIPTASLRTVAFYVGLLLEATVSKQAMHKRLHNKGIAFLEAILGAAMLNKSRGSDEGFSCLGFKRILLQDSTSMKLPLRMRDTYKGPGNSNGKSSSLKVQAVFNLLEGVFDSFKIGAYVDTDMASAKETVALVEPKDLLCWDLGYFNLSAFRDIIARGADILTRAKSGVIMSDPESRERIDLLALLESDVNVDTQVLVGGKQKLPMRLVAFKLPRKVAQERRRKAKATAKRKGQNLKKITLKLLDWQIYLTSCSPEQLPAAKVKELYAQRWSIEILFKAFKSHMRLADIPPHSSVEMVQCLVYAALVRITLCHTAILPWARATCGRTRVSILKFTSLLEALGSMLPDFQFNQEVLEANVLKHCLYDKRKRTNLFERLESLG